MATKQRAAYKAGSKKAGSKKAGSKKASKEASASKKPILDGNDPPIIVSGGGGSDFPHVPGRGPGKNKIDIEYSPAGGPGSGKFKGKVNTDTKITGVTISFPGMSGAPAPVTLSNFDTYKIQITFSTAP